MGCTHAAEAATKTKRGAYHDPAGRRTEAHQPTEGTPHTHSSRMSPVSTVGPCWRRMARSHTRRCGSSRPSPQAPSRQAAHPANSHPRSTAHAHSPAPLPHPHTARAATHAPQAASFAPRHHPPRPTKNTTKSNNNQNAPVAKQRRVGRVMPNGLCVQRHRLLIAPRLEVLVPLGLARLGGRVALRLLPARRCRRCRRGGRVPGRRRRGGRRRTGRGADRRRRHPHHRRCGDGRHRRRRHPHHRRCGDGRHRRRIQGHGAAAKGAGRPPTAHPMGRRPGGDAAGVRGAPAGCAGGRAPPTDGRPRRRTASATTQTRSRGRRARTGTPTHTHDGGVARGRSARCHHGATGVSAPPPQVHLTPPTRPVGGQDAAAAPPDGATSTAACAAGRGHAAVAVGVQRAASRGRARHKRAGASRSPGRRRRRWEPPLPRAYTAPTTRKVAGPPERRPLFSTAGRPVAGGRAGGGDRGVDGPRPVVQSPPRSTRLHSVLRSRGGGCRRAGGPPGQTAACCRESRREKGRLSQNSSITKDSHTACAAPEPVE